MAGPRKKGARAETDFPTSELYGFAMDEMGLDGLTIVPAKKPDTAIIPKTVMTKDGPVVVFDTSLIDEDGINAALYNLWVLTGFDPENQE